MSCSHTCTKLTDNSESEVLRGDTGGQRTFYANIHRLGLLLQETLCRQHMLDLAGTDTDSKYAQSTMRGGMRVTTDKRHPGQGKAQLGSNDMHNTLLWSLHIKERQIKVAGILLHRCNTELTILIHHIEQTPSHDGRHIMVKHG